MKNKQKRINLVGGSVCRRIISGCQNNWFAGHGKKLLLLLLVTIKPNKSFQFNKYLSGMCHGPLPQRQMTIII